jgi:hypothetical protein
MPGPSSESTISSSAPPVKGSDYLFSLNRDLKALNAAVLVITQKIKYLVRNEKILGRNLIVINKRVRDLQTEMGNTQNQGVSDAVKVAIEDLTRQVNAISQRLAELESKLDEVSRQSAKVDDVKEIKYVIDAMNPLHFVTIDQAKQMLEEKEKK